ncbi:FRG domain-containing protein [Candidatus Poribacteria bacterium]|nr:FRG domain-containing protein [Candidatus Poribacteria bacterium]
MNTQNSTDLQDYYLNGLNKIINEIMEKSADGNYIYRGEPKCYPTIASQLYLNRYAESNQRLTPIDVAQAFEIVMASNYLDSEAEKEFFPIASELRHYGSPVNYLDFTTDYNIALYFACAKHFACAKLGEDGHGKDGRIVLLQRNKETKEKYQIKPVQDPPNRAKAQKSVFVEPPDGFILSNDKDVKTVCIPKELKQWILIHLHRFQCISYQTLYHDIYGYIAQKDLRASAEEKHKSHEGTERWHIAQIEHSPYSVRYYYDLACYYGKDMYKYDCAIETFSKAILLKPDSVFAHINRGISYARNNILDRAIQDFVKVIPMLFKFPFSDALFLVYKSLGQVYDIRGDCHSAIEYYQKAQQLRFDDPVVAAYLDKSKRPQLSKLEYYVR